MERSGVMNEFTNNGQSHLSKGKLLNFISTQSEEIVYCEECANKDCCGTKETFNVCGVKNPFCCMGIKNSD